MDLAVYIVKSRATVDTQIPDNPNPFSWVNVKKWGNNLGIWGMGLERGAARGQRQLGSNCRGG